MRNVWSNIFHPNFTLLCLIRESIRMWRVVKITSEVFLICREIHLKGGNVITQRWKWFQINVLDLLVVFNLKKQTKHPLIPIPINSCFFNIIHTIYC